MASFQDQTLTCRDCGNQFTWTAGEQEFYQKNNFTNPPVRCADCRRAKKARMDNGRGNNGSMGPRQSFPIVCSNCGKEDTVPFQPKGDRPVLCRDCFRNSK